MTDRQIVVHGGSWREELQKLFAWWIFRGVVDAVITSFINTQEVSRWGHSQWATLKVERAFWLMPDYSFNDIIFTQKKWSEKGKSAVSLFKYFFRLPGWDSPEGITSWVILRKAKQIPKRIPKSFEIIQFMNNSRKLIEIPFGEKQINYEPEAENHFLILQ